VNKEDIAKYLRMLGEELQKKQAIGEILLVGGAVMLLEVGNREVTKDIDAYFEPKYSSEIREAAIAVANREGLPQEVFSLIAKYTRQQKLEARVQYIVEELFDV